MEGRELEAEGRQLLNTEENRFIVSEMLGGFPAQDTVRINTIFVSLEH